MSRSRVLVVDDDPAVRKLLRTTFGGDELEIAEAADGATALALAQACAPELVVLDWNMPGLAGDEVLAELKRGLPDVRVIVLTADGRVRARALAADVFLTKPFSPLELLATIDRLLAQGTSRTSSSPE